MRDTDDTGATTLLPTRRWMLSRLAPRTIGAALLAVQALGLGAFVDADAQAQSSVVLAPTKDNTMWDAQSGVYNSNGAGQYLFAGKNDLGNSRRALIAFDVSTIPAGSVITSVKLTMNLSRSRATNDPSYLHRMLADWGEGTSNAPNDEGRGATPTTGDATWIYRFFNTQLWTTPGGDFVSTPSITQIIGGQSGVYNWTGPGLVADVQHWIDNPGTNFGWVLRGNETVNQTAMRFDSRENPTVLNRPSLSITYTPPATSGACCFPNGSCVVLLQPDCIAQGGTFRGTGTSCSPNPCPPPTGACCLPNASCVVLTLANCTAQGGTYRGDNVPCSPDPCAGQVVVDVIAGLDNTLYEVAVGGAAISNGQGTGFFAGGGDSQNPTLRRRGAVKFDLAVIPSNAVILDASLRMFLGFTQDNSPRIVRLHAALASWGEGASTATSNQTNGAPAQPGDATWIYRFFNTQTWTTPGGDFVSASSASATVGTTINTFHTWTGPGLIGDVQNWVMNPTTNHGWIVIGADETIRRTQRRFDSSESFVTSQRPTLTITYTIPAPTGACCLPNGSCVQLDSAACTQQGGTFKGVNVPCAGQTCPIVLTPFVDALPRPAIAQPVTGQPGGPAHYEIDIREVQQQLHRDLPPTRVWGYAGSYPGPTIEARSDSPVTVTWRNQIRVLETQQLRTQHVLPVDTCLHGPDMTGEVPVTVTHLHGGHVAPDSDGYPEDVFPPGGQSHVYLYPNGQPAGTIWYHDHALGITRLNVYMGLAGFYLIRDDIEDALNLPRGDNEIALAIQDRSFNPDGSLKYHDMWMEHFFGDFILVNGKVWPFLNVNQGKYRFRLLNGSTSRTYRLSLSNGATFWQIGTDTGLLPGPVPLTSLTITPGERADLVIDFAPYASGTQIILTNDAPAPFPNGTPSSAIPNVMKFVVQAAAGDTDPLPLTLAPFTPIPPTDAVIDRPFILRRGMVSPTCPSHMDGMWMINDLMWDDITEFPVLGTTEIWSWINRSSITHPMHMHLVSFQVLDRQDFDFVNGTVVPIGPRVPPAANEYGWKDTVQAPPNQITRVIARFDGWPGRYPYHCHILEHEDHEMMRQFESTCPTTTITTQPAPVQACRGGTAQFTIQAAGYRLSPRWLRNGVPLVDGPTGNGSVVSGSGTTTLSITNVSPADAGTFSCNLVSVCGNASSTPASLSVCVADFNCDDTVDFFDYLDFVAAFDAESPTADVNADGVIDFFDYLDFVGAFDSGC